jgi:hypothetical protein
VMSSGGIGLAESGVYEMWSYMRQENWRQAQREATFCAGYSRLK